MNEEVCPSCMEHLPKTRDAFCCYCHAPLEEDSADAFAVGELVDGITPLQSGLFGVTFISREPFEFSRCYKCDSTSNLATTSAGDSKKSIGSYLFAIVRFVELLKNRTDIKIPICKECRFSIWPLRLAHLVLLGLCFLIPYLIRLNPGQDYTMELAVCLIFVGPLIVLTSYVFFRDYLLGAQVHRSGEDYKYIVAKRFRTDLENDMANRSSR